MIHIGLNPVAFTLGSLSVRWYGVMVLLSIVFLVWWTIRFAGKAGYGRDFLLGVAPWAILCGFIGAKLFHLMDDMSYYLDHPGDILNPAGLAIFGGILGGVLGAWVYCRLKGVSFAPMADLAAPGIILAQAIGRVGCTINGCCYGKPSSLPWAVTWTHPNSEAPLGIAVHPTQIYEILWDLLVFSVLWWLLRGRLKPSGSLFTAYLAFYSVGSFSIRFLRGDVSAFAGIFNEGQIISLLVFIVATILLVTRHTRWILRERLANERGSSS